MPDPFEDTPISSFEDLDPERDEGRGLSHMREFLLGLALIVAVLVWSGYHWVDDQRLLSTYRAAQQAETAQDLDHALALYQSIPGYKDSNTRAYVATISIAERNKNYSQAVAAAKKNDWPAVYQAAKLTSQVEAGYKDTESLIDESEKQVYSQALSGTVALRPDGDKPGLYYRTPDGWVWLRGSDQSSRVQGLGPPGHLVYDIPSTAATGSGASPAPTGPGYGTRGSSSGANTALRPPKRTLMLATIKGKDITFCQLALNPLDYSFFIWGEHGVWGLHYDYGILPAPTWGLRTDYSGYKIDYQAFNSPEIKKVQWPNGTWVIMDFAASGDAMLVAAPVYAGGGIYTAVHLYLAGPDGQNLRTVFVGMDEFRSAHFSPDGRYVLLTTYHPVNYYKDVQETAVLIDLKTDHQAIIAQVIARADTSEFYPAVGATFLTQGKLAGKVLLFVWDEGNKLYRTTGPSSVLTLIDPASPQTSLAEVEADTYPLGSVWISEGQGGQCLLVAWQNGLGNALPSADTMTALKLEPGRPGYVQKVDLGRDKSLTGAWLRDGNMVFTTRTPAFNPLNRLSTYSLAIQSVKLGAPASGTSQLPALLYTGTTSGPPNFSYTTPLNAGSNLLSYVDDGQLHAQTYDGAIDLPLDPGITALYNFPYTAIHWLK